MAAVFLDNAILEERRSISRVVCISYKPAQGAPTREESWARMELPQHAEATDLLTVFHRRRRCPGHTTCTTMAEFLCFTCTLPERREGGGADTLPVMHVYATTRPCTMGVALREVVEADILNEPWIVLGAQGMEGQPTPCNQSHCLLR